MPDKPQLFKRVYPPKYPPIVIHRHDDGDWVVCREKPTIPEMIEGRARKTIKGYKKAFLRKVNVTETSVWYEDSKMMVCDDQHYERSTVYIKGLIVFIGKER